MNNIIVLAKIRTVLTTGNRENNSAGLQHISMAKITLLNCYKFGKVKQLRAIK